MVNRGHGPAMSGNVLHHRQDAAVHQAFDQRTAQIDYGSRIARQRTIADDVVGALDRNVEYRRAIDIDAQIYKVVRNQPRVQIGRLMRSLRGNGMQRPDASGGHTLFPMRRFQPCNAPAFLIDQYWRSDIVHGCTQRIDETADLFGIGNISAEKG